MKIEEILGFTSSTGKDSASVSKRYYIRCGKNEGPDAAKKAFESFAENVTIPAGLERSDVALDEEKNANGLYFGTITFKSPDPKTKRKIADDLYETYGGHLPCRRSVLPHGCANALHVVSLAFQAEIDLQKPSGATRNELLYAKRSAMQLQVARGF